MKTRGIFSLVNIPEQNKLILICLEAEGILSSKVI